MDHIFIALNRDAFDKGINEISGIRTNGKFGYLTKSAIKAAFTAKIDKNFDSVISDLKIKLDTINNPKFVVVAHNGDYLRTLVKGQTKENLFIERLWIDLSQLAWPLLCNGMISARTLDTLCSYFKVEINCVDSADDCSALAQIYGQLMQRYKTALSGEETIREIGGDTLEGIRRMVGF